jgi:acetyl-CoA carboxylase alpha subunit
MPRKSQVRLELYTTVSREETVSGRVSDRWKATELIVIIASHVRNLYGTRFGIRDEAVLGWFVCCV